MKIPEALKKALLEGCRIILIAIIPLVVDGLNRGSVDYRLLAVTAAITALRFVDKLLHEIGKEQGKDGWLRTKGLTGF